MKSGGVDYPTLQKAVFALAAAVQDKGLSPADKVLDIAVSLGAKNFKGLDPSKFAEALAAVNARLAEVNVVEAEVA